MNLYLTDFNQNATLIPIFMHGLAISSMCCASDLDHNDKGIWSAAGIFIPYQFCPAPVSAAVDHPDC